MAKMTVEQFREKYIDREKKVAELKYQLEQLRKVDKTQMASDFAEAYGLPQGYRLVHGRVPKRKASNK